MLCVRRTRRSAYKERAGLAKSSRSLFATVLRYSHSIKSSTMASLTAGVDEEQGGTAVVTSRRRAQVRRAQQ